MSFPNDLGVLLDGLDRPVETTSLPEVAVDSFAKLVRNRGVLSSVKHFLGCFFNVEHRLSRNYSPQEVAEVLVKNRVCEDIPSALSDVSQVVGNLMTGVYGFYRWNEIVNPAAGKKHLYLSYVSQAAYDP